MARVYSTRFGFLPSFSGGPTTFYTVPAGFVAVVKTISIVWGNVRGSGLDVWVQDDALCKLVRRTMSIGFQDYLDYGGSDLFYGTWVFPEASSMAAQTAAGTVDITCSGYLLSLP